MSRYVPRTTPPDPSDLRWINTSYGGFNRCIVINDATGLTIPNCTGYVHGRWMEVSGFNTCPLSVSNAANYYGYTADGMERGSEPKLGAVICFSTAGGQPGHVAIVEEIVDSDTIITSDSNYGAEYFVMRTRHRSMGWNWWSGSDLVFQGFIYNPDAGGMKSGILLLMLAAKKRKEDEENGKSLRIQQYTSSL